MRPGNTSPESRPRLPVAPLGCSQRCEVPRQCGERCPNGVAQAVPVASLLPTMSLSLGGPCLLQRLPQPATAFPTPGVGCWLKDHAESRPCRGRGAGAAGLGALVLALTGVVDLHHHTGGSFTHSHLAFPFRLLALDIEGLFYCIEVQCIDRVKGLVPAMKLTLRFHLTNIPS